MSCFPDSQNCRLNLHFELNYDANGIDNELSKINPVSECGYFSGTTSSICADVLANIF